MQDRNLEAKLSSYLPLYSSLYLDWEPLLVQQLHFPAGEISGVGNPVHLVCLTLKDIPKLEQSRNNKNHTGYYPKGSAQIVPAGTPGTWRHSEPVEHMHIALYPNFVHNLVVESFDFDPARFELADHFFVQDPQLEHLGLTLLSELVAKGATGPLYREALANAVGARLITLYSNLPGKILNRRTPTSLAPSVIKQACEHIQANLTENIHLHEIARSSGVSTHHFAALFRRATGLAPHQYLISRRVERAKELLLSTDLTIAQVALAVGFADQSHLTCHMRRRLGVTPSVFKQPQNVPKYR